MPSLQLFQQYSRRLEVARVKALGEPAMDGCKELPRFVAPVLCAPERGQADRRPQLEQPRTLPPRDHERLTIALRGCIVIPRGIEGIAAQPVHLGHVRTSQLILAMTLVQCREIERRYPFARGRVFQLDHAAQCDIADPVGQPAEVFDAVARHIERAVAYWIARMPAATAREHC